MCELEQGVNRSFTQQWAMSSTESLCDYAKGQMLDA